MLSILCLPVKANRVQVLVMAWDNICPYDRYYIPGTGLRVSVLMGENNVEQWPLSINALRSLSTGVEEKL